MKIKEIKLYNFGSYEGENHFSFEQTNDNKRVVVIGGKNGAGKTTLFTALQICLYGHYTFGFRNNSTHYLKEIYNLINNKTRMDETSSSYIQIGFDQITDADQIHFSIKRKWLWESGTLIEKVFVWKNGSLLDEEDLLNFQNYLIHLIPPDLLKLYFFDGEKVADYFLGNREVNIRDALMVLSGNDTFDILYENVRRVLRLSEGQNGNNAKDYLDLKAKFEVCSTLIEHTKSEIFTLSSESENLKNAISTLTKQYTEHGGVTLEEWTALHTALKEEEEKRERFNMQRKSLATDLLPFIITSTLVSKIPMQIKEENAYVAYQSLIKQIATEDFISMLNKSVAEVGCTAHHAGVQIQKCIHKFFSNSYLDNFTPLFGLSNDEEVQIKYVLNKINSTKPSSFKQYLKQIQTSLNKTKSIRSKIQNSDIEHFEEYVSKRAHLIEQQNVIQIKIEQAQNQLDKSLLELSEIESQLRNAKKAFEDQLKKESVSALSGRILLLLEDLQKVLYTGLIEKVQHDINIKFRQLIRKKDFFTEIKIDNNFSIHLLRLQSVPRADLIAQLKGNSFTTLQTVIGKYALSDLQTTLNAHTVASLRQKLQKSSLDTFPLLVEIDKDHLSSGEKQIFVMSLYWAIMQQSKNDLPYVIDTPFARIDTQHRKNITDYFFKQLNGQLIVLSTDEEISESHMLSMKDQIAHVYMLEYGQDKSTHIQDNVYFEV